MFEINSIFATFFPSLLIQQITVVIIAVLLFFICRILVKRIFRWIGTEEGRFFRHHIRSIKLQEQELLKGEEIIKLCANITSAVKKLVNLFLLCTLIVVVLTQFGKTKHIPEKVWFYVSEKYLELQQEFLDYIPNLVFIILIAIVAHFFVRIVRLIFDGLDRGRIKIDGFYQEWARPTFVLVRLLIIAFAFVIIFPYLPGSQSPALKGLSIFIGVLVSLGSTSAITNIIAGVAITYMRAFQTGDRVKIAETTGDIVEKTLLVTRVRTPKNVVISIPNAMVMNNHIVNYSTHAKSTGVILHTSVTIGYDVPWRKVHALLIESSKGIEWIESSENAFVLQNSLGDFSVEYELNVLTHHARKTPQIYSQLNQAIQDNFNKAGVEIMSPTFSGIRDANHTTIPEENLDKDYKAEPFKFSQILTGKPKIEKS